MSISNQSDRWSMAVATATRVFSGATPEEPRWAITSGSAAGPERGWAARGRGDGEQKQNSGDEDRENYSG